MLLEDAMVEAGGASKDRNGGGGSSRDRGSGRFCGEQTCGRFRTTRLWIRGRRGWARVPKRNKAKEKPMILLLLKKVQFEKDMT